ncbi:hypothetical protein EJ04DRAFT_556962 [Polyplosphaeria fusca]|uniref:F-box domain-containing protein n=1 Tax=Polyplosphaeria fusca TaxID=682080 RepID=A0A9P4UXF3_9PLEO|nr:hypothetical protein EJ04DRAFT_556962 [Polyplosphaeria fusca]
MASGMSETHPSIPPQTTQSIPTLSNLSLNPSTPSNGSTPTLPTELWLQILSHIPDLDTLYTSLRLVSRTFASLTADTIATHHLPSTAISLTFPRRDSNTLLKYAALAPSITFTYSTLRAPSRIVLTSPRVLRDGPAIEELRAQDVLSKERLESAPMVVGISCRRGGAVGLVEGWERVAGWEGEGVRRGVEWDEEGKVWRWVIDWRALVVAFLVSRREARRRARRPGERRMKENSPLMMRGFGGRK